jgi:hypothetical protein
LIALPLGISFHLYSSAVKPASALAMDERLSYFFVTSLV